MGFLIKELLKEGMLHDDVRTVFGQGLEAYTIEPRLGEDGNVLREKAPVSATIRKSSPRSTSPSRRMAG